MGARRVIDWSHSLTQLERLTRQVTDKLLEAGPSAAWRTPSQKKALRDARRMVLAMQECLHDTSVWIEDNE
jgi:hypothetical protein